MRENADQNNFEYGLFLCSDHSRVMRLLIQQYLSMYCSFRNYDDFDIFSVQIASVQSNLSFRLIPMFSLPPSLFLEEILMQSHLGLFLACHKSSLYRIVIMNIEMFKPTGKFKLEFISDMFIRYDSFVVVHSYVWSLFCCAKAEFDSCCNNAMA